MANNCNNWITFEGSKSTLSKLEKKLKTYDKSKYFTEWSEYVIGEGKLDGGEGFKKKYGDNFNVFYMYGTKWFDFEMESDDHGLRVYGDSAWSPPIKLVEEICKKYKLKAEIEYEEGGCDFGGRTTFDEDGITKKEDYSYDEWQYRESYETWEYDLGEMFADEVFTLEEAVIEYPYAKKKEIEKIYNEARTKEKV